MNFLCENSVVSSPRKMKKNAGTQNLKIPELDPILIPGIPPTDRYKLCFACNRIKHV